MIQTIDHHHLSRWKNASITHFACKKTLRVKTYRKLYASRTWGVPEAPRISPTPDLPKSPPPPHREVKRPSSDFASTRRSGTETVTLPFVASVVPRAATHRPSLGILTMMMPSYTLSLSVLTDEKESRAANTKNNNNNKQTKTAAFYWARSSLRENDKAQRWESFLTLWRH